MQQVVQKRHRMRGSTLEDALEDGRKQSRYCVVMEGMSEADYSVRGRKEANFYSL
jgi:hypothetical protein